MKDRFYSEEYKREFVLYRNAHTSVETAKEYHIPEEAVNKRYQRWAHKYQESGEEFLKRLHDELNEALKGKGLHILAVSKKNKVVYIQTTSGLIKIPKEYQGWEYDIEIKHIEF